MCKCAACMVLPDLCRAFRCPSHDCRSGKVCPRGDGGDGAAERSPKNWQCLVCGHQCVGAEIRVLVAAEEALAESLESADELGEPGRRKGRVWSRGWDTCPDVTCNRVGKWVTRTC